MTPHSHPGAAPARRSLWQTLRLPVLGVLAAVGLTAPAAQAVTPIPFDGTTYTQNFDTLPTAAVNSTVTGQPIDVPSTNGTLPGWQYQNTGSGTNSNFLASDGSSNNGAVYSLGPASSGERALGSLASGSYTGRIGAIFQNTTGATLNSFTLSYVGEQWRSSTTTQNVLSFSYAVTAAQPTIAETTTPDTTLDFVGFPAVASNGPTDGNDTFNRKSITGTVNGVGWGAGQFLVIRFDDVNETGSDAALGIDNLSFSALAPAPGTVAFANGAVSVNESDGNATLTVSRTSGGTGAISVNYAISPGSATAADYGAATDSDGGSPGVINWADGDVADKTITIPIVDDTLTEGNETFTVTLSDPTGGATLGTPATATVTIVDNDVAGTFAFSSATYSASEAAGTATITVVRTIGTSGTATVNYATSDGSATAGADYTATTGTLTFADGVDTQSFTVPLINDTAIEGDETVTLTLSGATAGALIGTPNPATLTILSDDAPVLLLNELKINPAGSDNGAEYVEIKGAPGAAIPTGTYFVSIEGDSGGTQGNATLVTDLGGQTLGSNGLLVIAGPLNPYTFDPATTFLSDAQFNGGVLQNGSNSFAIIFSPTTPIASNSDLDTNDDGALDLPAGAVLTDAVGYTDGGAGDQVYGGVTLTQSSGTPDGVTRFLGNDDAFSAAAFYNGDIAGTVPTDNDYDPAQASANLPTGARLTPGAPNTLAAPAAPTITSFTPTSGPVGTSVVITGTNFTGATQVAFNGTATANFTVDSATQITAVVPMGATTGTITVSTPGGTATSPTNFTVVAAPTISSFTPASGPVGTSVVITGTAFTGATQVAFNGTAATFTVNSATQITATVPNGATTGTITVSTPGGTATSADVFTVTVAPVAPVITSFAPTSGPVGTSVVITGSGFTGATAVAFNGTAATAFTVDSDTQITATVPAGATTGTISVTAPGGTATSADVFTVTVPTPAPTITSFAPTSGPVGTSVVITGTNLTGATQVSFNGTLATAFTVDSDTQITATVPTGATTGTISVSTPGGTATSVDVFTVTAAGPNQPPTVADVAKTTLEDTPVGFTAAEFDAAFTDPNAGDTLQSITIVSLPTQGTINGGTITVGQVIARADIPTLAYTPGANFNGTDSFQYNASDGQANAATPANVNITVTAVNDAPSFALGTGPTVAEDAPAQTVAGFASAISPGPADEAAQTVLFTTVPATAADAALFTAGGQPAISPDGTLTFTPAPNANGTANFTVTLQDNGGTANGGVDTSAPQAFSITVTPVNDAPTISAIGAQATLEDTPTGAIAFTIGDVDGDAITVSATSSDQAIVPDANIALGGAFADRTVVVTPAPNANGTVNITVTVSDGTLTSSSTFALAVTPVNDAPSFTVGPNQTVDEDAASQSVPNFISGISAGPANEATQSLFFTTTNNNPALFTDQPTITAAGTLGYTPAPNQNGVATVSVVLADNGGTANGGVDTSATQTFTITINAVNDAPLAAADGPYFTDQNVTLNVPAASGVLANDTDVDSPALTAVLINDVARGTLTLNPDGSFTYAPEAGFRGTTSFSYAASDGALQSEPIVVTIGVNATPQNISFGVSITPKAPKTNDVLTATPVIFDPVGVSYTYEWSVNGVVKQSGASNTYNLASAGNGDKGDRIVCTVRAIQGIDSGVASNFVNVFNSAPSTSSQSGATTGGVETSFTLTGSDPDGDALTFKRVGGPVNGVANIVANANGTSTLFYTPRPDFGGVETIRFVALDTIGKPSAVQTVTINVTAAPAPPPPPTPNRAPSADDVTAMTFSGALVAIPLSGSDPDGDPITFKRVGGPRNGTGEIRLDSDGIFKMFYTPRANFAGTEIIRFVALDTIGKPSPVATMTIEVIPPASAMRSHAPAPSAGNS